MRSSPVTGTKEPIPSSIALLPKTRSLPAEHALDLEPGEQDGSVNYLREAEVEVAGRKTVRKVCKGLGVSEHTYPMASRVRWDRQEKRVKESEP